MVRTVITVLYRVNYVTSFACCSRLQITAISTSVWRWWFSFLKSANIEMYRNHSPREVLWTTAFVLHIPFLEVLRLYRLFLGLGLFFNSLKYTQSVGLLGRWISLSQGHYLHTEQHKHRINTQTSMPRVGFEPTTPMFERAKTVNVCTHGENPISAHIEDRATRASETTFLAFWLL
jgi:hypothetical protein